MALFEFEDGHLVPAQFGYPVAHDLGPELVDAICQQVLQIVSRPLFPVTWRDMTGQVEEETPRLTALDVTGQIVSVEILKLLDSETLITSLSRLAVVASLSWSDLAAEYPSGPEGFRAGWAQFRDSMPPAVGPGPRLIMVAGEIDPSVRPALSILATSGVEVHLMNLRQMSNGRLFLDVNAVGPRLYGHAPQLLGPAAPAPEIGASIDADTVTETEDTDQAFVNPEGDAEGADTPTTRPTPKVAPHLRDVFSYSVDEEPPPPWKPAEQEGAPEDASDKAADVADGNDDGVADERDADQHTDEADDRFAPEGDTNEGDLRDEANAEVPGPGDHEGDEGNDDVEAELGAPAQADQGDDAPDQVDQAEAGHADEGEDDDAVDLGQEHPEADQDDACVHEADGVDDHDDRGDGSLDDRDQWDEHDHPQENAVFAPEQTDNNEEFQDVTQEETPRWERPAHLGSRASRRAQAGTAELNDAGATDAATASFVDHAEESPEVVAARDEGVPVLGRDEAGLRTLAQILGEDTPLVARGELGLPDDLVLAAGGTISGAGLTYPSLDTLLTARGLGHIDAWTLVRIGDRLGPTLAEALDEVNREIVREYAHAPRERRAARH